MLVSRRTSSGSSSPNKLESFMLTLVYFWIRHVCSSVLECKESLDLMRSDVKQDLNKLHKANLEFLVAIPTFFLRIRFEIRIIQGIVLNLYNLWTGGTCLNLPEVIYTKCERKGALSVWGDRRHNKEVWVLLFYSLSRGARERACFPWKARFWGSVKIVGPLSDNTLFSVCHDDKTERKGRQQLMQAGIWGPLKFYFLD